MPQEQQLLMGLKMAKTRLYIPSKGGTQQKPLFNKIVEEHEDVEAYVFIYEEEIKKYSSIKNYVTLVIVPTPDNSCKYPIAEKRRFMMKYAVKNKHRYILMCDDDVKFVIRDKSIKPTRWGVSEFTKPLAQVIRMFDYYSTEPLVFPSRGMEGIRDYAKGIPISLDKSMPACVYRLDVKTLYKHKIQFKRMYAEDHEFLFNMMVHGLHSQMLHKVGFSGNTQGTNEIIYKEDYSDMQASNDRIWDLYKDSAISPIITLKKNKLGYTEVKTKGRNQTRTEIIDSVNNE